MFIQIIFLKDLTWMAQHILSALANSQSVAALFENPKQPDELGNLNTCTGSKAVLIFIYAGSRNSLPRY